MKRSFSVLRNTGWNFAGMVIPIAAALVAIPFLIHGLGIEQFGILAIGWVVMGYFALFDLGLGRATTKFAAEHFAAADQGRLSAVVWTSLHLHAMLGLAGGAVFALLAPWLADRGFNIPPELRAETRMAFYWLAASIPFIVVAACLRGLLEAADRFDAVNRVRIAGSLVNYLAPLLVLQFTHELVPVIAVIALGRVVVLAALARYCLTVVAILPVQGITAAAARPLFAFGGWVTVSSLVAPVIMVADRVFIAGFFSLGAVTYYVTPYEIVTKLWIFSASLMGALFPVMSAMARTDPGGLQALGARAERYLLAATVPVVAGLLVLGREFLLVWVGPHFAEQSTAVAKWLALGVLVNVVAQVPITAVQAAGRPDLIAILQLVQLPPFVALAWYLLHQFGSVGVAMAWAARATVEALLSWWVANRVWGAQRIDAAWLGRWAAVLLFLEICWVLDSMRYATLIKLAAFLPLLAIYLAWQWRSVLNAEERSFVRSRLGLAASGKQAENAKR